MSVKEELLQEIQIVDNKYFLCYAQLIERAKKRARVDSDYIEKHHYLPSSLGGTRDHLVSLTPREHFICHRLLEKFTLGKDHQKMSYALWRMTNLHKNEYTVSSRVYEYIRNKHANFLSVYMSGENNPNYRAIFSDEHKGKLKEAKRNNPNIIYGFSGKNHTDQTKESISNSKKGTKNPNYQGVYITPWGRFNSAMEAALNNQEYGFSETKILKFCKNNNNVVNNMHVCRNPYFTEKDKDKTFKELGFDFIKGDE